MLLKDLLTSNNVSKDMYRSNQYLNQGAPYLNVDDVTMLLNALFDGAWSFEIVKSWEEEYPVHYFDKHLNKQIDGTDRYFYVHGRLTVKVMTENGPTDLVKDDIGSNCVRKADKSGRIDYSSGYKSAVSSAIKGCAANLNIAVLDEGSIKRINEFVAKKKISILRDKLGDKFGEVVNQFIEKNKIDKQVALTAPYVQKLVLELEEC